jgi:hypothetical protein
MEFDHAYILRFKLLYWFTPPLQEIVALRTVAVRQLHYQGRQWGC